MFIQVTKAAAEDDAFCNLPSSEAKDGLLAAKSILSGATTADTSNVKRETEKVIGKMKDLLKKKPSTKALREKLWVGFFHYIKSEEYTQIWVTITERANTKPSPVLHYFITRCILNQLIYQMYPVNSGSLSDSVDQVVCISDDEEAALAYVGGYLIRALIKKINTGCLQSKAKAKAVLIHALYKFLEHPDEVPTEEVEDEIVESKDWMSLCNRGGLFCVRTEFNNFLLSVEIIIKKVTEKARKAIGTNIKLEAHERVKEDEDVLFWWEILCSIVNIHNDTAKTLLEFIVDHYVTVRGFAFTSRWLENYKINKKKNIQKV